jgi:hypothetical protein
MLDRHRALLSAMVQSPVFDAGSRNSHLLLSVYIACCLCLPAGRKPNVANQMYIPELAFLACCLLSNVAAHLHCYLTKRVHAHLHVCQVHSCLQQRTNNSCAEHKLLQEKEAAGRCCMTGMLLCKPLKVNTRPRYLNGLWRHVSVQLKLMQDELLLLQSPLAWQLVS